MCVYRLLDLFLPLNVSMKSGLEGRNNATRIRIEYSRDHGRLNEVRPRRPEQYKYFCSSGPQVVGLNEVRPRRPEQWYRRENSPEPPELVSMKSGLEGRNNVSGVSGCTSRSTRLNEVRPRRPEQYDALVVDSVCIQVGSQ